MTNRRRAALYVRVSRDEQTPESQLGQLRQFAAARGWQIVFEYSDTFSGASGPGARAGLRAMLADAYRGRFDVLLFWALDRLTRQGIHATLEYLEQLERCGIEYHSATEPEITNAGPMGELFVAIRGYFARMERERLSERTRAGLERARRQGKTIGRPKRILDGRRMLELREAGASYRAIADELGTDAMTVRRRLAQLRHDIHEWANSSQPSATRPMAAAASTNPAMSGSTLAARGSPDASSPDGERGFALSPITDESGASAGIPSQLATVLA